MHVRHILFAVTPGVNVHALSLRAEAALLELSRKEVPAGRFRAAGSRAVQLPSSAAGATWAGSRPKNAPRAGQ